jgi:hypothetical protein
VPKKVRRGGRYTTGIKRTSTGGYGGQTYGRRGCMVMIFTVVFISAGSVAAMFGAGYLALRGAL